MSLTARITCVVFIAGIVAACGPKREEVVVTQPAPAPVTTEPTYTNKWQ